MKNKDINLFNKTIHDIKITINDIEKERRVYNNQINTLLKSIRQARNSHDKKMKDFLAITKETLDEIYELFDDLYNGEENNKND